MGAPVLQGLIRESLCKTSFSQGEPIGKPSAQWPSQLSEQISPPPPKGVNSVPSLPLPKGCFWTHKNDGARAGVGGDGQTKDVLEHRDQDLQASGCHEAPDEGFREVNGNKAKLHEAQAHLEGRR